MNPTQKIKKDILFLAQKEEPSLFTFTSLETGKDVDETWEQAQEGEGQDVVGEIEREFREGEFSTGIKSQFSRHYEAKEVGAKLSDGSVVGWTFWFGGGKHGEPEAIGWMEDAYDLDCVEEEKVVLCRTFKKKGEKK